MKVTETRSEDKITLSVEGRIDTTTAPELQNCILAAFQKGNNIVVDFEEVAYISSAGLRSLLIGQKTAASKGGKMVLANVSDTVMEIFDTTGFSDILNFEG
ncbi:MAG: STAS domain-containing protein [Lachnospiraceae bacterium]|nr:STAS domain-containing protein [Lachnospiraceae bacterium]